MRKYNVLRWSGACLCILGLLSTSCDKNDEPTKYALSFTTATIAGKESDLTIEVSITLDKPAPDDLTVKYKLAGTAIDEVTADAQEVAADYTVDGDFGEIAIAEGELTGKLVIVPFSDLQIDEDETIEITLSDVDEDNIEFDAAAKATVTLQQEDGMLIGIDWPAASTTGVADMDLLVYVSEALPTPVWELLTGSAVRGFTRNFEFLFLPKTFTGEFLGTGDYTNTLFGFTYTYYDGSGTFLDSLGFTSTFAEYLNGDFEADAQVQTFDQYYTKDNLNKWVSPVFPTIIAQTIANNAVAFGAPSEILKQASSSRVGSSYSNTFLPKEKSRFRVSRNMEYASLPTRLKNKLEKLLKARLQ